MANSWLKISRKLQEHWIWRDADRLKWWLDLLFMASCDDSKQLVGSRLIEIKRGQIVASISYLVKRWGINHNTVIRFLKTLKDEGMIEKTSVANVSIITVCDYEKHHIADNLSDGLNTEISDKCTAVASTPADNVADNSTDSPADNLAGNIANADNRADNLSDSLTPSVPVLNAFAKEAPADSPADIIADNPTGNGAAADNFADNLKPSTSTRKRSADSAGADNLADKAFCDIYIYNNKYKYNNINNKNITQNSENDFSELEEAFEIFRKRYPGMKRGHKVEFENFKKKNPSKWQSIVPLLLPAIEREIRYHEESEAARAFVPSYAHLSTWINQSRWTTEFPTIAPDQPQQQSTPTSPIPAKTDYSDDDFGGADY